MTPIDTLERRRPDVRPDVRPASPWRVAGTALMLSSTLAWLPVAAQAADSTMSKAQYRSEHARITDTYQASKERCDAFKANAKDVCVAQAKAERDVAIAELDRRNEPSPRRTEKVAMVRADSAYDVARERCDDLAGNSKDQCVKEAKTAHEKALADAKLARTTQDNRQSDREAAMKARAEKREADYELALQRCDALAGDARASCARDVKARFGQQ